MQKKKGKGKGKGGKGRRNKLKEEKKNLIILCKCCWKNTRSLLEISPSSLKAIACITVQVQPDRFTSSLDRISFKCLARKINTSKCGKQLWIYSWSLWWTCNILFFKVQLVKSLACYAYVRSEFQKPSGFLESWWNRIISFSPPSAKIPWNEIGLRPSFYSQICQTAMVINTAFKQCADIILCLWQ